MNGNCIYVKYKIIRCISQYNNIIESTKRVQDASTRRDHRKSKPWPRNMMETNHLSCTKIRKSNTWIEEKIRSHTHTNTSRSQTGTRNLAGWFESWKKKSAMYYHWQLHSNFTFLSHCLRFLGLFNTLVDRAAVWHCNMACIWPVYERDFFSFFVEDVFTRCV